MSAQSIAPIKMTVRRAGDVRIHTFVSSFADDDIADATHIIESKNQLVLIDGQFLVPYATRFREYADDLRKPISRLYLTHRHPDHWFGLAAAFGDVPVYALSETKTFIEEHGKESLDDHSKKPQLKGLLPDKIVVPQEIAQLGAETLDGVQYVFSKVEDTEVEFHLIIGLPDLKISVVQDLIYSGTHLYLPGDITAERGRELRDIVHWIDILGDMLLSDYEWFLAGHGLPADKNELARNIEYLLAAKQAIDNGLTDQPFKDYMLKRYPARQCPGIFDIYIPRLFHGARQW